MGYVLITGATGGIGSEFCRQLVMENDLLLTGRSQEKLENLKSSLLTLRPSANIELFSADLTDFDKRQELFDFADNKGIKFSGLFSVAGVDTQKEFIKYTQQKIAFQIRVNVESTIAITHGVLLRREKDLKILTVSSMSGTAPMPYFAIYSATKATLNSFFKSLRYEVKDAKITTLMPGSVPTREDIKKDIQVQGLTGKLSSKPVDFVVKKALKGLEKNKQRVIPGAFNKFIYFIEKITPKSIQCRYIAKKWSKKEKDNF